jgi:hypothetical protein
MTKRKRLSSNLTLIYKYFVPLIPFGLAILVNLTIDKDANHGYFIPLNLFFLLFFLTAYLPLQDLKKVEYDRDNLIISNFIRSERFRLKDIIQIKRWMFFFFKISVQTKNETKKFKFLAPSRERIFRPFKKLDTIADFENKLNNIKNGRRI